MAAISSGTISVPESGPSWLAQPDRMLKKELAGLDDWALLSIVRLLPQASERWAAACELLVTRHQGLVCQAQIGQRLCISQMHVSRLRTHALGYLRSRLLDLEGTRANAGPALATQPPASRAPAISASRHTEVGRHGVASASLFRDPG